MALTALQTTSELVDWGVQYSVTKTAVTNMGNSSFNHLNASKLTFTRNRDSRTVPQPNSPEVFAQNVCTNHMITCHWDSQIGWAASHL